MVNSSSSLSNNDVCFLVEGVAYQIIECARIWGIDPVACSVYASVAQLPADDLWICEYVDKLDVPDAIAFHSTDALGRPYLRCLPPSDRLDATDLSHEALETLCDSTADRWVRMPNGTELAVEICDPCQGDRYQVQVTVLGETRSIWLSNFVLGSFFDPQGKAPFDRMGTIQAPFGLSPGGYEAVIDATGNEHDVFARLVGNAPAGKLRDPGSRLVRRLRETRP